MVPERLMQHFPTNTFAEASVKGLHVGARSDLGKEILSDYFCSLDIRETFFTGVVLQDLAIAIKLNRALRQSVQLCGTHAVNSLVEFRAILILRFHQFLGCT